MTALARRAPSIALALAVGSAAAFAIACSSGDSGAASTDDPSDAGGASADGAAVDDASSADPTLPEPAVLEPGEIEAVGAATSYIFDERAFDQPATTLTGQERSAWIVGQATFQLEWTEKPSADRGGLGPTFNAISCEACHTKNGRGAPPAKSGDPLVTTLLRLSVPGASTEGGPLGDATYGDQFQPRAIPGVASEGTVRVTYESMPGTYGDGTPFTRVVPRPTVDAAFGALPAGALLSIRLAQQTLGMGFLEAIADADILAREDPDDADGDGISGRANRVWDVRTSSARVGRFGWKASQPTVEQQSAAAFAGDVGITSTLFPSANCPPAQTACAASAGSVIELTDARLAAVTTFMRGTSVPARRGADTLDVLRGKTLFRSMGCASCHTPSFTTGSVAGAAYLDGVKIWPYTDLLVHDMGEGLADDRPDFAAGGREWRTPPLWGLGLMDAVSGHERFLHDGRARGIEEAILWHGGEGADAAERFRTASKAERALLVAFIRSL